jgi:hypothetical protein
VYSAVTRGELADVLVHCRDLYRQREPANEREALTYERREIGIRQLLSNLPRTKEHPTLRLVLEVADLLSLTLDDAHRLFGYDLGQLFSYDLRLNSARTHIVQSLEFAHDRLIDLPLQFAMHDPSRFQGLLADLIEEWQTNIPVGALEATGWYSPGAFYVHVGTEDSLGSGIPSGSVALVEPVDGRELSLPNPRQIYLLQFGNGYRCSRCVVSRGKLHLLNTERAYFGPQEFSYPGEVRIAGRIRVFAMTLPLPEYSRLQSFPVCRTCADLILPWEHRSRSNLFAAKHRRFRRSREEEERVRDILRAALDANPSGRTERRYRSATRSEPHINTLLYMTLSSFARYSDSLHSGGHRISDAGRYSLETLLKARHWTDLLLALPEVKSPQPERVWDAFRDEFVQTLPLLLLRFPHLSFSRDHVLRFAGSHAIQGLEPALSPGSWLLLNDVSVEPDIRAEQRKSGWSRPIYVLRRGMESLCGYLERDNGGYALISTPYGHGTKAVIRKNELSRLYRVAGAAVPV